jgi:hypothetical protein
MVAGYRCSVFGIAAVDAPVRKNVVIATAPFTSAFAQQDFIDRDHNCPNISISMQNHNPPARRGKAAAVLVHRSAPENPIDRSESARRRYPRRMLRRAFTCQMRPHFSLANRNGPSMAEKHEIYRQTKD